MSEAETPDRLTAAHTVKPEDIRSLMGAVTPHFALQVRNRVRRLIAPLAADDPARIEGERALLQLEELSQQSGESRGQGPSH